MNGDLQVEEFDTDKGETMRRVFVALALAMMMVILGPGGERGQAAAPRPTVTTATTCIGFPILFIEGSGFAPDSPITVTVHSSVLSFVISGLGLTTDQEGNFSFGDEIISNSRAPNAFGMVTVADASGNRAVASWGARCIAPGGAAATGSVSYAYSRPRLLLALFAARS